MSSTVPLFSNEAYFGVLAEQKLAPGSISRINRTYLLNPSAHGLNLKNVVRPHFADECSSLNAGYDIPEIPWVLWALFFLRQGLTVELKLASEPWSFVFSLPSAELSTYTTKISFSGILLKFLKAMFWKEWALKSEHTHPLPSNPSLVPDHHFPPKFTLLGYFACGQY